MPVVDDKIASVTTHNVSKAVAVDKIHSSGEHRIGFVVLTPGSNAGISLPPCVAGQAGNNVVRAVLVFGLGALGGVREIIIDRRAISTGSYSMLPAKIDLRRAETTSDIRRERWSMSIK